jgi:serine/threonine protein kinase
MAISSCPVPGEWQKLATGHLPPAEMEPLFKHLEACATCLHQVQALTASDTLLDALAKVKTVANGPEEEMVSRLIERLNQLGGPAAPTPRPKAAPAAMVSFPCARCGKNLKAKAVLAGKKVKCPQCAQALLVPENKASEAGRAAATPAPASILGEEKTLLPRAGESKGSREVGERKQDERDTFSSQAPDDQPWDFLAPPQQPDEMGRLGPYRILTVLGAGGMGVVFRAEDPHLERPVALKAMLPSQAASPSAKKRFLREAKSAAAIKHDHIVAIYQVGEDRGTPFLAMEFLEGEPLDKRLERENQLPLADILRIGREIAEGLGAAHDRHLIHRDIKPANIWLESVGRGPRSVPKNNPPTATEHGPRAKDYRVKILDFGLARSTADTTGLTQQGAIVGTPQYMAPEQASGEPIDYRCDLFSLGCVLYRLCTGRAPFSGTDTISILLAVATQQPQPPQELNPDLPSALAELVLRLLAKEPNDRPRSAAEVVQTLEAVEAQIRRRGEPIPQPLPPPATAPGTGVAEDMPAPAARRRLLPLWLAGGAMVGLLVLGIVLLAGVLFKVKTKNGTVVLNVNEPGAQVFVDDDLKITVTSPSDKEPVTITVPAGKHVLKLVKGGFQTETREFTLKAGTSEEIRVTLQREATPIAAYPDRRAAEWALKLGGRVVLEGGRPNGIDKRAALPKEPFRLKAIVLPHNKPVDEAGLSNLRGLSRLRVLALNNGWVNDAGLAHLADLTELRTLELRWARISDEGLAALRGMTKLEELELSETPVTGAGLVHLKGLTRLRRLGLALPGVDDASLEKLRGLKELQALSLDHTTITDAGLVHLEGLPELTHLNLVKTRVTDEGLKTLSKLPELTSLSLNHTRVTGPGLAHLKGARKLRHLYLLNSRIDDEGLRHLPALPNLHLVYISNVQITDRGLAHLKGLTGLDSLAVQNTAVTGPGLEVVRGMPRLRELVLSDSTVGDAGLEHLKGLTGLRHLDLSRTKVTAAAVQRLKAALPKCNIVAKELKARPSD